MRRVRGAATTKVGGVPTLDAEIKGTIENPIGQIAGGINEHQKTEE